MNTESIPFVLLCMGIFFIGVLLFHKVNYSHQVALQLW